MSGQPLPPLSHYLFEGKSQTNPATNGVNRQTFLKQLEAERSIRVREKVRNAAALKIQSAHRSYASRRQEKLRFRQLFDSCQKEFGTSLCSPTVLSQQLTKFQYFFDLHNDGDCYRLIWLCQQLLKCILDVIRLDGWGRLIGNFASNCTRSLIIFSEVGRPIALQLRILELSLGTEDKSELGANQLVIVERLIRQDFYVLMRKLLDVKVPSDVEFNEKPPSEMARFLFIFIRRPITLAFRSSNELLQNEVLGAFCSLFMSAPMTPAISNFFLPAVASTTSFPSFPANELLRAMTRVKLSFNEDFLHSLLMMYEKRLDLLSPEGVEHFLQILGVAVPAGFPASFPSTSQIDQMPTDQPEVEKNDEDAEDMELDMTESERRRLLSFRQLNNSRLVQLLYQVIEKCQFDPSLVRSMCQIAYTMVQQRKSTMESRLVYFLCFKPDFVRCCWRNILALTATTFSGPKRLIDQLQSCVRLSQADCDLLIPQLTVFCSLFSTTLVTVHDSEFYQTPELRPKGSLIPFSVKELIAMSGDLRNLALGLIELALPDSRADISENYRGVFSSLLADNSVEAELQRRRWNNLFEVVVQLLKLVYERDVRLQFCPDGHWTGRSKFSFLTEEKVYSHIRRQGQVYRRTGRRSQLFGAIRAMTREELEEEGAPLAASELRKLTVLKKMAFVVPFRDRVGVLQQLIQHDRAANGRLNDYFGPNVMINVRRNFLYEDSFEKLSVTNEPNLRLPIRVHMTNWAGLDEAGIDGGGIFREFLGELLMTAFDPSRGFFVATPHDRLLYPNPMVMKLFPDNFHQHYEFLGRMLGKAIYENLLIELPFASFFLTKLLAKEQYDVDIHHLASLDPVLHKNLLYLKFFEGNARDLELDFSVEVEEFGEFKKFDLKPNGRNILVDNSNRIEFVHLYADFYLNRQINAQTFYFRQGLSDLIDFEWLGMFDSRELQVLISGADSDLDVVQLVANLREFTTYSGAYSDNHPVIESFWSVVSDFSKDQLRKLLKFVTSISRPPLLGFKDLYPPFNIQSVPEGDRLPSASTCMNLLKLPMITTKASLKQKLIYAIEAGAGFELS